MASLPQPRITQAASNFLTGESLGRKQGIEDQNRRTMLTAGDQAASGNLSGARDTLFKGGQFDKAMATQNAITKMADQRLAKAKMVQDKIARIANVIETPEQFEAAKARLRASGYPVPKHITFEMLPQLRAEALSVADQMTLELRRRQMQAGGKPTANMREYQFDMQQRQQRGEEVIPFSQWQQESKSPLVTIEGEKAYDKTAGKELRETFGSLQSNAQQAANRIGQLRQIDALLSNPNVYTGTGAQAINALKRTAQTLLGQENIEGVADADAARRISTEMALSLKENLPGPMSDSDRNFLQEIPPSIGDTAEGRKLLVELMADKEQRKIEIADLARQYASTHGGRLDDGWYQALAEYNQQNPVFDEAVMQRARDIAGQAQQPSPAAGALPRVMDVESYNNVPPGSRYIDPEGRIRTKGGR